MEVKMLTRMTIISLALLMAVFLAACTSDPSSDYDYASLIDDLRAAGLTVDPPLAEESRVISSAPANIMYLNENYGLSVSVFEYADAAMAKAESAYISPDGEQISIPGREARRC